tara:strand:- start:337 stop:618 length:282 start_codon:yes stop_codon:yes gene_type:complete
MAEDEPEAPKEEYSTLESIADTAVSIGAGALYNYFVPGASFLHSLAMSAAWGAGGMLSDLIGGRKSAQAMGGKLGNYMLGFMGGDYLLPALYR